MVSSPKYIVLKNLEGVEIRKYPPLLLARTLMQSKDDLNTSFRKIANYIFGSNESHLKIPMTAPVILSKEKNKFFMSFVMPEHFTQKNIPKSTSPDIHLSTLPASKIAVVRFSGFMRNAKVLQYERVLRKTLKDARLKPKGNLLIMQYNPPWTLPFLRRNEIGLKI